MGRLRGGKNPQRGRRSNATPVWGNGLSLP